MALIRPQRGFYAATLAVFFAAAGAAQTPSPVAPVHVSSGVVAGNIVRRVNPAYPMQASAHNIQGTVLMHAIIGKDGAIHHLSAVSGPALLQSSAMDAVRQWQFKPYLLNGNPVEIETDIAINFFLPKH